MSGLIQLFFYNNPLRFWAAYKIQKIIKPIKHTYPSNLDENNQNDNLYKAPTNTLINILTPGLGTEPDFKSFPEGQKSEHPSCLGGVF